MGCEKENLVVEHGQGFGVDEAVGAEDRDGNDVGGDGAYVSSELGYDVDDVVQMSDVSCSVSLVRYEDVFVDLDTKLGSEAKEGNGIEGSLGGRS